MPDPGTEKLFHDKNEKGKIQKKEITIGVNSTLTLLDVRLFLKNQLPVILSDDSKNPLLKSYQFLKECIDQRLSIYGINTHFGDQVSYVDPYVTDASITFEDYYDSMHHRQQNLIKSHACGLGNTVQFELTQLAMLLRIHCVAQGYSGVNPETVQMYLNFINARIIPLVPCYGSIGASGDLIPLATIAAAMIGEDIEVLYNDQIMKASEALRLAKLEPLIPQLRDGLAIINGTSFMTAIASLAGYKLKRLFPQMLSAIAMSLESLHVITSGYQPLVHRLKKHKGEIEVNEFLNHFWKDSLLVTNLDELREAQKSGDSFKPLQDYYSIRSVAQGFGPFYENLIRAITWIENEMNSINDNPIIDSQEKKIHHSANFMGYYITDACDLLKMDIAQASTWIHALLANMVHPRKNHNLPANLIANPGTHNGFRPIQLLAAALAVENRKLAQTHQSFMLPTEGDNQDVNSLGTHAALDFLESVSNLERLTAILLLASTQALEIRGVHRASQKAQNIYAVIREVIPPIHTDRPLSSDLLNLIVLLDDERI